MYRSIMMVLLMRSAFTVMSRGPWHGHGCRSADHAPIPFCVQGRKRCARCWVWESMHSCMWWSRGPSGVRWNDARWVESSTDRKFGPGIKAAFLLAGLPAQSFALIVILVSILKTHAQSSPALTSLRARLPCIQHPTLGSVGLAPKQWF